MLGSTRRSWLYTGCMVRGVNRGTWVDDLCTRSSSVVNVISQTLVSAKYLGYGDLLSKWANRGGSKHPCLFSGGPSRPPPCKCYSHKFIHIKACAPDTSNHNYSGGQTRGPDDIHTCLRRVIDTPPPPYIRQTPSPYLATESLPNT